MSRDPLKDGERAVSHVEGEPFRRKEITHVKFSVQHTGSREVPVVELESGEDRRRETVRPGPRGLVESC